MQQSHTRGPPCRGKPRPRRQIGPRPHRGGPLILGAIIAGGRASRFGGDKGAALLDGVALLDHAIAALRPHVARLVVVGRDWKDVERIEDRPEPGLGPLGGIAGALRHARQLGFSHVLTIGCDTPRLPAKLIETLLGHPASYCTESPVLGHWPAELGLGLIGRLASGGDRSIRRWARESGAIPLPSGQPIANVNRAEDLAAL